MATRTLFWTGLCTLLAVPAGAGELENPTLAFDGPGMATRYHDALPWKPVTRTRPMRLGEHLSCERQCRVRLADGTVVTLDSGAEIVAASPVFHRFGNDEMASRCMAVHVRHGEIQVQRLAGADRKLVVTTEAGVTAAIGTGMVTVRSLADRAAVVNRDGQAQAKRRGGWNTLARDLAHTVDADGNVDSRAIVTTPEWLDAGDHHRPIGFAAQGPHSNVGARGRPVASAANYTVEVAAGDAFDGTVRRFEVDTNHFATKLPEGRYLARVSATDADGFTTEPSQPRTLRVLRIALPPGGFMPSGNTMVVPEATTVRLLDSADVEVSMDRHGYHNGVATLPPPARDYHMVRVRMAKDHASATTFRLEKRTLHAQVSMTPRLPTWPTDRIEAKVQLADPSGHIDPLAVMPDLEVRVGGKPVKATWSRHGDVFRTVINGRALDGPQLVEVVARDDLGQWIGWGFVEVVATR